MDYIQQDLDLIRTATGDADEEGVQKQTVKKKISKRTGTGPAEIISKREKGTAGARKNETKKMKVEEKKARNSPTLGKIKLPFIKKQQQSEISQASPKSFKDKKMVPVMATKSKKTIEPQTIVKGESSTSKPTSAKVKGGIDPNATPLEAIRFVEDAKIEAVDNGIWYKAKIVKVDEDKMEILVHFVGWGSKFDRTFSMTSAMIRGRTQLDEKPDVLKFEEGEDVLGKWSDGNFYPATVLKVAKSGSYNVMFFDGLKKSLRPSHLKKMTEKEKEEAMLAAQKLLLLPPECVLQDSSGSSASPSSDGRRYRTSANDREKRLNARSHGGTPAPVRNAKRKADVLYTPEVLEVSGQDPKDSSDGEAMIAKKARLDKITTNLISRVSPNSESRESDRKEVTIRNEEETPKSSKMRTDIVADNEQVHKVAPKSDTVEKKEVVVAASTKKTPARRGRPPKQKVPQVKPPAKVSPINELKESLKSPDTEVAESIEKASREHENTHSTTVADHNESLKSNETPTRDTNLISPRTPPSNESSFQSSDIAYDESPTGTRIYKPGDIVLAKWSDCRSYLAYIMKKENDDSYKIRYYDGHVKIVKASFIYPWDGPLPDKLKIFKPKPPQSKRQRSQSIELKKGRGRPTIKTTGIGRGLSVSAQNRRRTIASISDAKRDSPVARRRMRRLNDGFGNQYRPNEKVLAKWTDLRWYPATVVKKMDNEHYQVMYADNMTKLVRDTWLSPWNPPKPDSPAQQKSSTVESSMKTDSPKSPEIEESVDNGGKIAIQFLPGRTVLARYTDGTSYPATVKEKLDGGKYLVEYDNGVRHNVKFSSMNPWSTTALPPLKKKVMRKLYQPKVTETLQKPQIIELLKQEKHEQAMSTTSTEQVICGFDAPHARSPVQMATDTDHHKFKCKAPGCTKSFRKEEMLRTHQKHYHQQRYKRRDQNGIPVTTKKKTPKDEVVNRRVSSDNGVMPKATITVEDVCIIPKSRGAKPPIEIYQRHHEQSTALSSFPITSSSSSAEDVKVIEKQPVKQSEITVKPSDAKPSIATTRKRQRSSDAKEDETKTVHDKQSDLPDNDAEEDDEASSDPVNEDVIRCTCNVDEEKGFMIQCEGCFTWQHAACVGVKQTESKKEKHRDEKTGKFKTGEKIETATGKLQASSDGYICWVCKHPQHIRRNRKYNYNNEFIKKGKLPLLVYPSAAHPGDAVNPQIRDVSKMMEEIVKMQESIIGIKNMIKIASAPNHPLLKTWNESVLQKRVVKIASESQAAQTAKYPDSQDQSIKLASSVKSKTSMRKNQQLPSLSANTNHKSDILRQKENLLDHVTELETELDSRITKLIEYISKLNENLGDDDASDSLQEDLTTVQRLLKNR